MVAVQAKHNVRKIKAAPVDLPPASLVSIEIADPYADRIITGITYRQTISVIFEVPV